MSAICLAVMSLPLCSVACVACAALVGFNLHALPTHGGTFGADDHDAELHLGINGNSQESRLEDAVARIMEEDDVDHLPGPPLKKQEHVPQLKYLSKLLYIGLSFYPLCDAARCVTHLRPLAVSYYPLENAAIH